MPKGTDPKWLDDLAAAIKSARAATDRIVQADREFRAAELTLRDSISKLAGDPLTRGPQWQKLADQLHRMGELQNMKEIGGFMIAMDRETTAAWRKLP